MKQVWINSDGSLTLKVVGRDDRVVIPEPERLTMYIVWYINNGYNLVNNVKP